MSTISPGWVSGVADDGAVHPQVEEQAMYDGMTGAASTRIFCSAVETKQEPAGPLHWHPEHFPQGRLLFTRTDLEHGSRGTEPAGPRVD
jgi:hypothetical protein